MKIRRVVTGKNAAGKSVLVSDGPSPRERVLQHVPGFVCSPLWLLGAAPVLNQPPQETMRGVGSLIAPPGGGCFLVITFPPDSVMQAPDFNPGLAFPEHAAAAPGIAETFEPDNPGMHQTPTLDYVTVISGEIVLELDDGVTVTLRQGDTVVQHGARHAWRNPGTAPAVISVVMLGARKT